jgi:hypothetical protein
MPTENPLTNLTKVDPNSYYSADKDKGTILGSDLEKSLWSIYNGAGGGGGNGGGKAEEIGLAGRSPEFMGFQDETTQYMSGLMKGASDTAEGMFGQGTYNQMSADNDLIVQGEVQKLQAQYGGNVNHPAFIKEKNDLLNASRMFNGRVMTDLLQKKAQYGLGVGDLVRNYYDSYSTKEENQQKLTLAVDQFNAEMRDKQRARAAGAANAAVGQQLAALSAIAANRKFEAGMGFDAASTELQARNADYITKLNIDLENRKLDVAERTAKAQQKNNIISGILGTIGGIAGALIGGPAGAAIGSSAGSAAGNLFGGSDSSSGFSLNQNSAPLDYTFKP